jgi:hypothetical protein
VGRPLRKGKKGETLEPRGVIGEIIDPPKDLISRSQTNFIICLADDQKDGSRKQFLDVVTSCSKPGSKRNGVSLDKRFLNAIRITITTDG